MEGNAFEHPLAGHIAEPDVFELDLAPDLGELHRILRVGELERQVDDREDLFCGSKSRLQPVELLRQVLNRVEKFRDIHIEGNDRSAGQRLTQELRIFNITFSA